MTKICTECKANQSVDNFPIKNHGPGTKHYPAGKCKPCVKIISRIRNQKRRAIKLALMPPKHIPELGFKTCAKCKIDKPQNINFFHKSNQTKDGLQARCKECVNSALRLKTEIRAQSKPKAAPGMKFCCNCHCEKSFREFYKRSKYPDGLEYSCKTCMAPKEKEKRLKNAAKRKTNGTTKIKFKKISIKKKQTVERFSIKMTRIALSLELGRISKEEYDEGIIKIEKETIEDSIKIRNRVKKNHNRKKNKHIEKLARNLRARTVSILKRGAFIKSKHLVEYLGCAADKFAEHIRKYWKSGMSWDNYGSGPGKWSLDHTIPFASARNIEEAYILAHYTNVRPMWSTYNSAKWERSPQE